MGNKTGKENKSDSVKVKKWIMNKLIEEGFEEEYILKAASMVKNKNNIDEIWNKLDELYDNEHQDQVTDDINTLIAATNITKSIAKELINDQGYDPSEIIRAMERVKNKNDIDEIIDCIDQIDDESFDKAFADDTNEKFEGNVPLSLDKCISTKSCNYVQRIVNALKYYSILDVSDSTNKDQQKLIEYCSENESLLDDYIHILSTHNTHKDLDEIYNLLLRDSLIKECDIFNCKLSVRHFRNRNNETQEMKVQDLEINNEFLFFRDLMDAMHCYLFHAYDTGMRVKCHTKLE
eukprot:138693_1